ncbi:MAG: fibronectin type III domain-containing protein [Mycetocola sp.]
MPFSVSARNDAYPALSTWNESSDSGIPAGAPIAGGSPSVSVDSSNATASVSWDGVFSGNGRPIAQYFAAISSNGAFPSCTVTGVGTGNPTLNVDSESATFRHVGSSTSVAFTSLTPGAEYQFAVFAYNGQGCTRSAIAERVVLRSPGNPSDASLSIAPNGTGRYDVKLVGATWESGGGVPVFNFVMSIGGIQTSGSATAGEFLGTGSYGEPANVAIQVCENHDNGEQLCSAGWSSSFSAGVPVRTLPTSLSYDPIDGTISNDGSFTWTGAPAGGGYASVRYTCDNGVTWAEMPTVGACAALSPLGEWPSLIIEVTTTTGLVYTDTYRGDAF